MTIIVILSALVLLAAPLLARVVQRAPALKGGIDGFVLITVLGLIILTLLPEAIEHGGVLALVIAFLGFVLPWASEFMFHKTEEITHRIVMLVATLALVIHAASDGAVLAFARDSVHGSFVATGILLHRVGIAIAVWWLMRPILTTAGGFAVLAAMAAMTMVAYFMVLFAGEWYHVPLEGYWQAFAAGSLLHVVMHPVGDHDHAPSAATALSHRIGTACGILFVIALIGSHYYDHSPVSATSMTHAHNLQHLIDLMAYSGSLVAPIALLLIAGFGIYGKMNATWMRAYARVQQVMPWTLVLWIVVALVAMLWPALLPLPMSVTVLFGLWMVFLTPVIVHTGARTFFGGIFPAALSRTHSHAHSGN